MGEAKRKMQAWVSAGGSRHPLGSKYPPGSHEGLIRLGLLTSVHDVGLEVDAAADELERIGDGDLSEFQPMLTRLMGMVTLLSLAAMGAGLDPEPPQRNRV